MRPGTAAYTAGGIVLVLLGGLTVALMRRTIELIVTHLNVKAD